MRSGTKPCSARTWSIPTWVAPRVPPPANTKAVTGRSAWARLFEELTSAIEVELQRKGAQRLQAILGCFDAFAAANCFRVVGVRAFGVAFLGADLPRRRSSFDRRMRTGLFRPSRSGVVSA